MENEIKSGKTFEGVVVKAAMKDTATVQVERYVKHPKYKKFMRLNRKFLVHDVGNTAQVGDKVVIRETRPISRRKHFILVSRITSVKAE
ncbi:30S ribosomal protein S17 [Candidatus Kaiserbacteria bacterium RIFCSPHIGHO2_01_FULL_54_36]|uniref:Small ribosomal subunit protein uS17 n=1 Tax=Candidatus Kaiserbacteria bacterium RIFCSPHIGHO2_01_FULL_54_36 TaxID=1798482 RepID=A0A1F6CKB3_9BACT|nr:MAG: 30S ribosomal protein S17 [Candidatus Kaiserbacteria bacterium RIFCSPHIGHO2_01_FULL_54_36]OGG75633.1 MAG: 30S ribosomal protein S17 [Candidatus Kaiserbacteria bacterium RIFCSPLOWO2_01_FULL_54_22]